MRDKKSRINSWFMAAFFFLPAITYAQSEVDLYQQNFENPNGFRSDVECTVFQGNAELAAAASAYTGQGSVPYYQVNTADRICITKIGSPGDIVDPTGTGGKYAIGFHGAGASAPISEIESIGFVFNPQGYRFLNGRFDASIIGLPSFTNSQYGFVQNQIYSFNLQFYEIPAGTVESDIVIQVPTAYGGNARVQVSGVLQTPLNTFRKEISNSYPETERFKLDWREIDFILDMNSMAGNSSVMMVITGLPRYRYMVVDNFDIMASINSINLPTDNITVMPTTTGNFSPLDTATNSLGLPLTVSQNPTINNPSAGVISVNSATGVISFTPVDWFVGEVVVDYEVCDNQAINHRVCEDSTVKFIVPAGGVNITKNLLKPAGESGLFDFSFVANCTLGSNPLVRSFNGALAGVATQGNVIIGNIPAGAVCEIVENLPSAPSGHMWSTPQIIPSNITVPVNAESSVTVNNILNISSIITINKSVVGGPTSGVTGAFNFTADCGTAGIHPATVMLNAQSTGSNTITTVPQGASCTISEEPSLPAAPLGYLWSNDFPDAVTLSVSGSGNAASFVNRLIMATPTPVPTLKEWGMITLSLFLALLGWMKVRRHQI